MAGQTSYTEIYGTLIDSWAGSLLEPFKQVTPILDARAVKEDGSVEKYAIRFGGYQVRCTNRPVLLRQN